MSKTSDAELTAMPVLEAWLRMCCETPELVANYNRLRGTKITFTPPKRDPIAMMVDQACGREPTFDNDPDELQEFFGWCRDTLLRLPMLNDPENFQETPQ